MVGLFVITEQTNSIILQRCGLICTVGIDKSTRKTRAASWRQYLGGAGRSGNGLPFCVRVVIMLGVARIFSWRSGDTRFDRASDFAEILIDHVFILGFAMGTSAGSVLSMTRGGRHNLLFNDFLDKRFVTRRYLSRALCCLHYILDRFDDGSIVATSAGSVRNFPRFRTILGRARDIFGIGWWDNQGLNVEGTDWMCCALFGVNSAATPQIRSNFVEPLYLDLCYAKRPRMPFG